LKVTLNFFKNFINCVMSIVQVAVTEFETRLNECLAVNDGEIVPAINQTDSPEPGTAADDAHTFKRPNPKQIAAKSKGRRLVAPPKRTGRNAAAASKKKVLSDSESSSSESSESSEEEENQKPRRSQAAKTSSASTSQQKKKTTVIESDTSPGT
jgi:hypothetical protein